MFASGQRRSLGPGGLGAAGLILIAVLSGCSTTFDLSALEKPVLLNGDPFVGTAPVGVESRFVGGYMGRSYKSDVTVSIGMSTTSTRDAKDDGQKNAFLLLGGHKNRAIINAAIEMSATGMNVVLALGDFEEIIARGTATEYAKAGATAAK